MKRLGIAIIVQNIDKTGGMERQALLLANQLVRRGARVWVISTLLVPGYIPRLPVKVPAVVRRGRLTIYRVPLCLGWRWESCLAFYELVALGVLATRTCSLDAIYTVHWTTALSASRVARFLACPLVVKFACGGETGDFAMIAKDPDRHAVLARLATVDRLVCISPQIADEARAAGLAEDGFVRIPNGIDLSRFDGSLPIPLPGPPEAEHVLVVACLRPEKRVAELVRAFAEVARARPRARLVIAGTGPEELAIRTAARETGLEDRVHLLGRRSDVPGLLAAGHVFVIASAAEGLSNALLEALAAGIPVVATDIEGNRAVLEHEKDALLVPFGDQGALARAIVRLLEDRGLATRLGRAGRATAKRYDLDSVASRHEQVFRELARPLPSSLRLVGRYFGVFDGAGVGGIVRDLAAMGISRTRFWISAFVVRTKRAFGIERALLPALRGARGSGERASPVRAKI